MRKFLKHSLAGLILCGGMLPPLQSVAGPASFVSAPNEDRYALDLGQSISDETLGGQTGRQDTRIDQLNMQITDMKNNAQQEGNILSLANGSTLNNGANTIGQGAFSNANGLVTVIQNSGNQVLIQNDMVLNLFVK